jgi:transcriptional regulator with XRE-family HTH domain
MDDEKYIAIYTQFRRQMKQNVPTQRAFGERIGVSGNYVHLLEKGVKKPGKTLRILLDFIEGQARENQTGKEKG